MRFSEFTCLLAEPLMADDGVYFKGEFVAGGAKMLFAVKLAVSLKMAKVMGSVS